MCLAGAAAARDLGRPPRSSANRTAATLSRPFDRNGRALFPVTDMRVASWLVQFGRELTALSLFDAGLPPGFRFPTTFTPQTL